MKAIIIELRLLIAEQLLLWAAEIAPKNREGDFIRCRVFGLPIEEEKK